MNCGSTETIFLRNNLEWLGRAINWAKFTDIASLGVIHYRNINDSKKILQKYLPSTNNNTIYSDGGSLYALGLIHAYKYDENIKNYFLGELNKDVSSEPLQHGACLGLGLLAIGTKNRQIYEAFQKALISDSAVVGESAAYGIGLIMLGSGECVNELIEYAHETSHEKIIRAISVSLALIMYKQEKNADYLIDLLINDKDIILRYGAMLIIGMSYIGTSNNDAIKKLLHISVSDVSDDVRRAAVISLGFVLCNTYENIPKILKLLSVSYNSHVRYGCCIAIGIGCCGRYNQEALDILNILCTDNIDFVRQGAYIGLGLLLQQSNDISIPISKKIRNDMINVINDKHEDILARYGCIIGIGIMDACGGNTTCNLYTYNKNNLRNSSVVGMLLFTQYHYWYPLVNCITLALQPTCYIGLNINLKIPKSYYIQYINKNNIFNYREHIIIKKDEVAIKQQTAILSTTLKIKKKINMDIDEKKDENKDENIDKNIDNIDKKIDKKDYIDKLMNPSRVLPRQIKYMNNIKNRYIPILKDRKTSIIMLEDTEGGPDEYLETKLSNDDEPAPPEPFDYVSHK
eukprot:GHVL01026219.1.p1 GENE.GHVL01026219.1~~GHVL01026219.1.p1  ORF type:complete len:574 (-),score=173.03 GHVL01026219.1:51-1772(-)